MASDDNIEGFVNADGSVTPAESHEERKARIEAEKAELDRQLANGELDGVEYNKKLIELRVPDEYEPKPRRKIKLVSLIVPIVIMVLLAVPAAIYLNWRFYFQNTLTTVEAPDYSEFLASSIDTDPIQIGLEGYAESGEYKGRSINITYKAYYDITGIVTSVRDYWGFGAYDALAPRDVCMAWGSTATSYTEHGVEFSQGQRNCKPRINGVEIDDLNFGTVRGKWGNTMYALYDFSNNHIISSTPEVRGQVFGLGAGDKVRMVGYLVNVSYDGLVLDSSASREDSGDHACEVFYVTKVEKAEKKN